MKVKIHRNKIINCSNYVREGRSGRETTVEIKLGNKETRIYSLKTRNLGYDKVKTTKKM